MVIPNPAHPSIRDAHFRKWGWSDEPAWLGQFYLPFTDQTSLPVGSVVLDVSAGKFDSNDLRHVHVRRVDDYYYLIYDGYDGTYWQTGIARSKKPDSGFTKLNSGDPILVHGGVGDPDQHRAWIPSLLYDEFETDPAKRWKIYYVGFLVSAGTMLWAYNSVPDTPFTKAGAVSGLSNPSRWGQAVNRFGKLYVNCYSSGGPGTYAFRVAVSNNPASFTDICQLITLGSAGQWDDYFVGFASLFWNLGVAYLIYLGHNEAVTTEGLGLATTWGLPLRALEKFQRNPIYQEGGSIDSVQSGCMLQVEKKFWIWHCSRVSGEYYRIYATSIP